MTHDRQRLPNHLSKSSVHKLSIGTVIYDICVSADRRYTDRRMSQSQTPLF